MIAVIGAGIAGLQAACQLQRLGAPFCVLEAGDAIGGLARTAAHQHWRYDYGVKALYSQDSAIMDYLPGYYFNLAATAPGPTAGAGRLAAARLAVQ